MQLVSGPGTVVVGSAVAAVLGALMLFRRARRRPSGPGAAHRLFAAGALTATVSAIAGLAGVAVLLPRWAQTGADRTLLASVVAVGFALGVLLLCAGLLALPGVARDGGSVLRHVLDALVIAAALWFVGWVLGSRPTRAVSEVTSVVCTAILLPAAVAAVAVGVAAVVAMRWSGPRRELLLVGAGVVWAAFCGTGFAVGLCQQGIGLALAGAAAFPVGLLLIAYAPAAPPRQPTAPGGRAPDGRPPEGARAADGEVIRRGTGYAFVPMIAMAVAGMYHVLRQGEFTALGIAAGSVEGFALVARQYLALLDVRRYARRLAEREAHFRELAHTDPLTGLANRRALLNALRHEVATDAPCVLVMLDLDGFKIVNDMRGHDVGDAVLMEVAQRLRRQVRPRDVTARLGGDEFAVLLVATEPAEAQRIAERLLAVLSVPFERLAGPELRLSVSVGTAGSGAARDVPTLLRNADLALRYAKQRGKNRVEQYDSDYDQQLRRRMTVEHELRGAVERGELRLAFQPVVAVPSVRPVGAEALLRWRHPELGAVRPDEFIPLAEECGQIGKLGAWVLDQACRQLSRWLADGHDVWVSVNVSPLELHAPEYAIQVAEALRAHRVPPQRLVLEVTEHAVATDLDELIRRLRALRATGVRIALDDFGAGYSSLGQLRKLPIDILKIDHSLVTQPEPVRPAGPGRRALAPMVDIVMRLGHQLGLEVIAEGVTNQAELAVVVEAGCRFGQGALFGWGVPAEHLEAMLDAATSPGARPVPAPRLALEGRRALPAGPPLADGRGGIASQVEGQIPTQPVRNVGSVDSAREMRQA